LRFSGPCGRCWGGPLGPIGIDAERAAIARFADAKASTSPQKFEEHESGKDSDALDRRPQLAAANAAQLHRVPFLVAELGATLQ
jgi:hypothetical protein